MRRAAKIWLITAAFLVLTGSILFVGVMTAMNWDFTKLSTVKYETNEHTVDEAFKDITVVTNIADVLFVPSGNGKIAVVCYEQKNMKHTVAVENGRLKIEVADARKWYEWIGVNFGSPKITVYLPRGEYGALSVESETGDVKIQKEFTFKSMDIACATGDVTNAASVLEDVKIKTSTGDIRVENATAGRMDLTVSTGGIAVSDVVCVGDIKIGFSTGKVKMSDVSGKNISCDGGTGDLNMKKVIAAEKIISKVTTGDIVLDGCDAAELFLTTDTGDVEGTLLTEKVFITKSDTGDVDVPKTITGGRCEITTDTGDITFSIAK